MKVTPLIIKAEPSAKLHDEHFARRQWIATRAVSESKSRRQLIHDIATTIYNFDGTILCPNGQVWPIPDIYDLFGQDGRWVSYYLQADETGHNPRRTTRVTERLRVLDLYFKIKMPRIARHFTR